jgi:hypothetical protein
MVDITITQISLFITLPTLTKGVGIFFFLANFRNTYNGQIVFDFLSSMFVPSN